MSGAQAPDFTIGIEEEYLLVDAETLSLTAAPDALIAACAEDLDEQVSPEFLQCQIEIGTGVCAGIAEAREDLQNLRRTVARHAAEFGLAPIAASCHPSGDWKVQPHRDKERYNILRQDMRAVAERMLICGMHVHVGIPEEEMRIKLTNQLKYFLPHLLALSTSSPYWQGKDTGLNSYRMTVFDAMPRTGLPPRMTDWAAYRAMVETLVDLKLIEDSSKIWWDLRPSAKFPTIEARICDVAPRLEDTLMLASWVQALTRMLWRRTQEGEDWRTVENFLIAENRWRAQRYGLSGGFIDFGRREMISGEQVVEDVLELIGEDIDALGCRAEAESARHIVTDGTSADRQRAVHDAAIAAGATEEEALRAVTEGLVAAFHDGV